MGAYPESGSSNSATLVTRRRFLYGVAGVAAVGVIAAGSAIASSVASSAEDQSSITALSVPQSSVTVFNSDGEGFTEAAEDAPLVQETGSYELPYGTLVWSSNDTNAACLIPTESANPLTQVGVLSLADGSLTTLLEAALGNAEGFEIYDARCSTEGLVWTEANILQGIWRVWSASFDGAALGTPSLLDEGDDAWETPSIAAVGRYAAWQCVPKTSGTASQANSCVKAASFGSSSVNVLYESAGRIATPLYAMEDAVVCTPRADASSTYYQLTRIDVASGTVTDQVTLPASMRPLEAGYGPFGFSFCFESSYSYGDGISGIGTYTPTDGDTPFSYEGRNWFQFSRTPSSAPAACGAYFTVKSTSSVAVIDLEANTYMTITAESGADDWGEQLASSGNVSTLVTFAHVDNTENDATAETFCRVRTFEPSGATAAGGSDESFIDEDGDGIPDDEY